MGVIPTIPRTARIYLNTIEKTETNRAFTVAKVAHECCANTYASSQPSLLCVRRVVEAQ